jgi:hypothetical protein
MRGMKLRNALVALRVCIFLLGVAWLQGVFERYHVPPLAAEMRKPDDAHALHFDDDGHAEVVPSLLELPPPMPRLVTGGFNQFVEQPPAWFRASPSFLVTTLTSYEPLRRADIDDGPEPGHVGPHPNNAIPDFMIPGLAIPGVGYYGPEPAA